MKNEGKRLLVSGIMLMVAFAVFTLLIMMADVQGIGPNGSRVGLAAFNGWFHRFTGVNMALYTVTDWLGLVPIFICMGFGVLGLTQLIRRKSLFKVDRDIIFLGIYYIAVIMCYMGFEMVPINYRPILINGFMEASYPSSTTLLVLSVMPTLVYQVNRRSKNVILKKTVQHFSAAFTAFMVIGRLISGVHWFTDIAGAFILSLGMFYMYKSAVLCADKK